MSYKDNHYVPRWHQMKFIPSDQEEKKYFLLDLKPETVISAGIKHTRHAIRHLGPKNCFVQKDLYTTRGIGWESTEIEQKFFGDIDNNAIAAVNFMENFRYGYLSTELWATFLKYMSLQKMRTPKGLKHLKSLVSAEDNNTVLFKLQEFQNINCALWSECVWVIADASKSDTKFIISDHPVTVYNKECFPASKFCSNGNDPNIDFIGTQTLFPLSLNKIVILTNLTWAKCPDVKGLHKRINHNPFRSTIMNTLDIQTERILSEVEVNQINYIIKKRAFRYIAAAKKEWLFPEKWLKYTRNEERWDRLGKGYLLMPDPRLVNTSSEVVIGYDSGISEGFDEYGHRPGHLKYADQARQASENASLYSFREKFERIFGKQYRGIDGYRKPYK